MATPFPQCRMSLAVDVSGSTSGGALDCETKFVRSLRAQLPLDLGQNVLVLPWNSVADRPCRVEGLASLRSRGGTNPVSLLTSEAHLSALKMAKVWFLLTDGDITPAEVNKFSRTLAEKRMHGVPVVIVIFDRPRNKPSECNISVGLSPFAAVPNSALLFQSVLPNGECYVLATKGCFNALLPPGVDQPVLDDNTLWSQLPTIQPESAFASLEIPVALDLSPEELALSDGLTVNFDTLFNTDLDDNQVDVLLGNQNHLQTLLLSAQAHGQTSSARNWLYRQSPVPVANSPQQQHQQRASVDVGGRAARSVQRITQALQSTHLSDAGPANNPDVEGWRAELREAHRRNSQQASQAFSHRAATIDRALYSLSRSESSSVHGSSLSPSAGYEPSPIAGFGPGGIAGFGPGSAAGFGPGNTAGFGPGGIAGFGPSPIAGFEPMPTPPVLQVPTPVPPVGSGLEETGAFRGECSLCFEPDAILSILFKLPTTTNPSSGTTLSFPLAMGALPHNDVISPWMCCYRCSIYLVRQSETPIREIATASLPLVSWSKNSAVWREALEKSLGPYDAGSKALLPVLFLAVLLNCLSNKAWAATDGSQENSQRRSALLWTRDTILSEVKISGDDIKGTVGYWITEVLLSPRRDEESLVWKYPMDGFVVMTDVARTLGIRKITKAAVTKLVWKKLLHTVTSRYTSAVLRSGGDLPRIRSCIDDAILATHSPGWLSEMKRLGFVGSTDLKALQGMTGEVEWIEAVAGGAMEKWLKWLKQARQCRNTVECIWEIKGRWGREVWEVVEEMDFEGEIT